MDVVLVSGDLMIGSRLAGLVQGCGGRLVVRRTTLADAASHDLAILDLQSIAGDPATAVAAARSAGARRVVAFGPHVDHARLEAARQGGADDVVSRGELLGGFPSLLARWVGPPASG